MVHHSFVNIFKYDIDVKDEEKFFKYYNNKTNTKSSKLSFLFNKSVLKEKINNELI